VRYAALLSLLVATAICAMLTASRAHAAVAGDSGRRDLIVASKGQCEAIIVVSPEAKLPAGGLDGHTVDGSAFERFAVEDLARCIELMTGARPAIADTPETIAAALAEKKKPVLIVGEEALKADPSLAKRLQDVAKSDPILRADAIVVRRDGNRVYVAGLTGDGHYHAVAELLHRWGCRWYVPTAFGECIPVHEQLAVGKLDYAYASPFEIRTYWISWNGSYDGYNAFQLRNRMTRGVPTPGGGHALATYTKELVPEGKTIFNIPIADDATAQHVAAGIDEVFKNSGTVSLAMEDGTYLSDSETDKALRADIYDKYFMTPSVTDVFMTFYNKVCDILLAKYPNSKATIGFLAYGNMTLPPQQVLKARSPLFCSLAPIDIDPNHGMDDPRSPSRGEFRDMVYRWSEVMNGQVWIYDYDQGALVWRDIPNPSHQAFRQDVRHYAQAGILGVSTESRNAIATVFLNLHLRGQLMWDPDFDVDAALQEFYPAFYGPAAEPMGRYWEAIFGAWEETIVTEHEFFMAPAIYTPDLIDGLERHLADAETLMQGLAAKANPSRNEELYVERMRFTRLGFDVLSNYMRMVFTGSGIGDYKAAHAFGRKALTARIELVKMNDTFGTRVTGQTAGEPEYGGSPAWFPGEVKLYGDLEKLTDGTEGTRVRMLPLEWAFRRDPNDTGLVSDWARKPIDLAYWNAQASSLTVENRKDYPTTEWEMLRSDLYMQAQGVLHPDSQAYTGHAWYRTDVKLSKADAAGNVHVLFPGLFADAWLYVNGVLVAHRPQKGMWWYNDYGFQWDVDVTGRLQPGQNTITLRNRVQHHVGGMFRRPFLYRPTK